MGMHKIKFKTTHVVSSHKHGIYLRYTMFNLIFKYYWYLIGDKQRYLLSLIAKLTTYHLLYAILEQICYNICKTFFVKSTGIAVINHQAFVHIILSNKMTRATAFCMRFQSRFFSCKTSCYQAIQFFFPVLLERDEWF